MRKFGVIALFLAISACSGGGGGGTPAPAPSSNQQPTADAGSDLTTSIVSTGVTLDGTGSSDPDGDALSYSWSISSQPNGANATISENNTSSPTLLAMAPGEYIVRVTVTDGQGGSSSDTATIDLQNDAPIIAIDTLPANVAVGETLTLNATGSTDPNGHTLTYAWSLSSAPVSSNLISDFDGVAPIIAFDVEGFFEVTIEVSDGYETVTDTVSIDVTEFSQNIVAPRYTYLETDAQNKLTVISEDDVVDILNDEGESVGSFSFSDAVTHLTTSPNGEWIGAAHVNSVSIIRVSDRTVFGPWSVSSEPGDLIIDNSGYAHVFPRTGQWVRALTIHPTDGTESNGLGSIRHRTIAKMHPDGMKAYGANNGVSPSDVERYDISSGVFEYAYDSPYHGDFSFCGNLWIARDGASILTACGVVVKSTDVRSTDLTFKMELENRGQILDAAYEETNDKWYLVENTSNSIELNIYDGSSGQFIETVDMPSIVNTASTAIPTHVVSDPARSMIKVFASDHPTNPQNFAILKKVFIDRNLLDYPPVTIVPNSGAGVVGTTVRLDASASYDPEGEDIGFSWSLVSEPQLSNILLTVTDTSSMEFRPVVTGEYVFSLETTDGNRTAQPETITVNIVEAGDAAQIRLAGNPSDIIYNKVKNQLLYTVDGIEELRIRNLDDFSEQVLPLSRVGEQIDVSPSGEYAAIAHAGLATLIDLRGTQASVLDTQEFSADWGDIVVDDRAIAFIGPRRDQWVNLYAIDFENDVVYTRYGLRERTQLRMHPRNSEIYGANRGSSPSDIEKWSVGDLNNMSHRDSPYHGNYAMSGNIWINEEGNRLVVAGGHVFRASGDPNLDMVYVDSLPDGTRPLWADHSEEADRWAILSSNQITLLTDTTYLASGTVEVEPLFIDPGNLSPTVEKVFFSGDGEKVIVIARTDPVTQDNYVVQIIDTPN